MNKKLAISLFQYHRRSVIRLYLKSRLENLLCGAVLDQPGLKLLKSFIHLDFQNACYLFLFMLALSHHKVTNHTKFVDFSVFFCKIFSTKKILNSEIALQSTCAIYKYAVSVQPFIVNKQSNVNNN